ncbi:hypothetical protein Salat_0271600 [Sesamum alatum]|uniref:Stigma-specific STIG1-like protein 1 n=1 Tax=Sesamum alatum TaxID=300844 RepID=A0AAE2CYJ7_9LAMI|nr:hypothetical protein Salat_0271600 [Sesamum alatum]
MLTALAVSLLAESTSDHQVKRSTYDDDEDFPMPESTEPSTSLRGVSRFLAPKTRFTLMRCNKYPRVCRVKGSPGPDCCKNICVNVTRDRFNCGRCGHKCKYSEICCKGKCINPFTNKQHCGGCNNKCKKGSKCMFGMCSYA